MITTIEVPCAECGQKFEQAVTSHMTEGNDNGITSITFTATDTEGELYAHMVEAHGR